MIYKSEQRSPLARTSPRLEYPKLTVRVAAGQLQGTKAMKNLSAILQAFRTDLPNSSLTAQAIDRGALLDEISQAAATERIHQLAAILFEAEQEETQDNPDKEVDLETLINKQILQLRAKLPDGSRTAKAIDRGATLEEISESAQEEGLTNAVAIRQSLYCRMTIREERPRRGVQPDGCGLRVYIFTVDGTQGANRQHRLEGHSRQQWHVCA